MGGVLRRGIALAFALGVAACGPENAAFKTPPKAAGPAAVDGTRIAGADSEPGNWLSHGRTYSEQRFSPLDQISEKTVGNLGLAWFFDLDTTQGQEATPLVIDGVMYVSTALSKVKALDAATGALLWEFDPEVPGEWLVHTCCGWVNRGVAAWEGKIFVGTLDGRLIALDAATGEKAWEVLTVDKAWPYTITGAPRVVKGKVLIGNSGAEFGVRGYIGAYDAETGALAWRFYTIPGDPAKGPDGAASDKAMEIATPTWNGEWWKVGGGGTVWDAIVYDPELDLLYVGVGNGSPWNQNIRSPGGGDNLFLSSILALRPDTGDYVWHYQETPGDVWDYTATQPIILADLDIDGETRKVLMQAPKNGFFYVLDRETGALISAEAFADITWATGVDLETGRPMEAPGARYTDGNRTSFVVPGPLGAHNWHSMAFNPTTGLVYFPAHQTSFTYQPETDFKKTDLAINLGVKFMQITPPDADAIDPKLKEGKGWLAAWNPAAQKEAWRIDQGGPWNGGVLATAGNLVFQGTAAGTIKAYRATDGAELWSTGAQTGVVAAPISYAVKGEQYVAVAAGWGGALALGAPSGQPTNVNRILAFKLGGTASLPAMPATVARDMSPPPRSGTPETLAEGKEIYHRYCAGCHGFEAVNGPLTPDLRYSAALADEQWFAIAKDGALQENGMHGFGAELSRDILSAVRDYVIGRAHDTKPSSQ